MTTSTETRETIRAADTATFGGNAPAGRSGGLRDEASTRQAARAPGKLPIPRDRQEREGGQPDHRHAQRDLPLLDLRRARGQPDLRGTRVGNRRERSKPDTGNARR